MTILNDIGERYMSTRLWEPERSGSWHQTKVEATCIHRNLRSGNYDV